MSQSGRKRAAEKQDRHLLSVEGEGESLASHPPHNLRSIFHYSEATAYKYRGNLLSEMTHFHHVQKEKISSIIRQLETKP